jgi:hypothetical protein
VPTIFTEVPINDPSFEAFLRAREDERAKALARYAELEKEWNERLGRLRAQEDALYEELVQGATDSLGARFTARSTARKMRKEQAKSVEKTVVGEMRAIERFWHLGNGAGVLREAQADYANVVAASQDGATLDPVLVAIPSSRVHVDGQGWRVYTRRNALFGQVELVRSLGNNVVVRGGTDDQIRAGILLAKDHLQPPLQFKGSPQFVAACKRIAGEYGLTEVEENVISGTEAAPRSSTTTGTVNGTTSTAATNGAAPGTKAPGASPAEAPSGPIPGVDQDAFLRAAGSLKDQQVASLEALGIGYAGAQMETSKLRELLAAGPRNVVVLAKDAERVRLFDKETLAVIRAGIAEFPGGADLAVLEEVTLELNADGKLAVAGASVGDGKDGRPGRDGRVRESEEQEAEEEVAVEQDRDRHLPENARRGVTAAEITEALNPEIQPIIMANELPPGHADNGTLTAIHVIGQGNPENDGAGYWVAELETGMGPIMVPLNASAVTELDRTDALGKEVTLTIGNDGIPMLSSSVPEQRLEVVTQTPANVEQQQAPTKGKGTGARRGRGRGK